MCDDCKCVELKAELLKANRRAAAVRKELQLPEGTVVVTPDGTGARIGKDGLVEPRSVRKGVWPSDTAGATHTPGPFARLFSDMKSVQLNDPGQQVHAGALPNSSAPLPAPGGTIPSFSHVLEVGRKS